MKKIFSEKIISEHIMSQLDAA